MGRGRNVLSEQVTPYLSEHQAPDSPNYGPNNGYTPSPEDKEIIKMVEGLYGKAKKYRKRYDGRWIDFYKSFRGRQWKEVRPAYRKSEVINLIFMTIESMVPTLTDSMPKLEFLPTVPNQPDQIELSDILNKVAENDWVHNNWLYTLTEILFDGHFYGTGFGHLYYDVKANQGIGNACWESGDPFYLFPDPQARDINERRCGYFVNAEPTSISQVKKEYPDKAPFISADVVDFAQGDKADIYQVMFKSPVDSKLIVEGPSGYDSIAKDQVVKITLYLKDETLEESEKASTNDDGTPKLDQSGAPLMENIQALKYPNGRKIVVAGGVLCEDGPMEEGGFIPYQKYTNYALPREFWGMGDVEQLEMPQKTFNKIVSCALDVMELMGNPIWVVGTQSGIDTDNLFNKPGLIVETDDINSVRREPGVDLQPFVLQLLDRYRMWIDQLSGQTDLSRGAEPQDVTAASAIDSLQQAQQTRLRLKSRNIDVLLQQFGKQYMNMVFDKYNLPRIIRVSGDNGANQFFQFHVEGLDQPDGSTKRMAHVTTYDQGVASSRVIEITSDFDIRVGTGSSLPFSKKEKTEMSFNLFKLGVIDDEELLKNLEYPNYEAVLQRVHELKAQAQAAQAAAQGGGGQPGASAGPPPPAAA